VPSALITIAQASTRYALSGVRGIPRAKGTAARVDGLVTEFERADAVEDIMTGGQRPSYWTHCAPRVCDAKGWEREHEGGECL